MPLAAGLYFFAYEREGAHPRPLVLLHGAGGTHLNWPPEIRRLPGYMVYAPDLPGHGKSSGPGAQSIQAYTHAIHAWMQARLLEPAVVIGHSMGSAIAMTLALAFPERVQALVLIGAGANLPVNPQLLELAANAGTFPIAVDKVVSWSYTRQANPRLLELAARRLLEIRPSVLHGDLTACARFDLRERLAEIQHPALVISGGEDKMTPLRKGQSLAQKLPQGQLAILPEAGHMMMQEHPQAVTKELLHFLEQLHQP